MNRADPSTLSNFRLTRTTVYEAPLATPEAVDFSTDYSLVDVRAGSVLFSSNFQDLLDKAENASFNTKEFLSVLPLKSAISSSSLCLQHSSEYSCLKYITV